MSPEAAEGIANFMHAHSQAPALGAAAQGVFGALTSLMDVGCGSGVYGIEIARAHPGLKVVLMDLKEMAIEAQKFIDRAGMGGQVTTAGVNMFTEEWPRGHDGHFFSNVFHDWSDETCRLLAKKSFEALPRGGRIFLNEILMDDDYTGPFPAAAFSLLMLVGTLGKQYSLGRIPRDPRQRRLRRCRGGAHRRRLLLSGQCPQALGTSPRDYVCDRERNEAFALGIVAHASSHEQAARHEPIPSFSRHLRRMVEREGLEPSTPAL